MRELKSEIIEFNLEGSDSNTSINTQGREFLIVFERSIYGDYLKQFIERDNLTIK